MINLDALEALANAATPGTAAPELIARVRELEAERDALRELARDAIAAVGIHEDRTVAEGDCSPWPKGELDGDRLLERARALGVLAKEGT